MRIAVCDDDARQVALTANYVKRWAEERDVSVTVDSFHSGEAFLFQWSGEHVFDLLFLDIHMGGMSGVELAEKIRLLDNQLIIVFITGLKEFVFHGYEVQALHYLLKPVKERDCRRCLDQAYARMGERAAETFFIPVDGQTRRFSFGELYYFEVFSHYVDAHTKQGVFTYKKKISDLEKELPAKQFVRCHRSCIVNLMHIAAIAKTELTLADGTVLPISGERYRSTNDAFLKYYLKAPAP